ncbi:hypothetical protein K490DRAFT_55607 [Saccharata proteae CBS 121410]|uniref:Uncharacterized protein n=1 Tax=Saccharata proteae CBS 121410 TaxID=1314787 RepID=A0A6A5YCD2_9PEZI|nr:hypothetical protein K490DRAFT_55607 [Saccharata proteae CBS 121410]
MDLRDSGASRHSEIVVVPLKESPRSDQRRSAYRLRLSYRPRGEVWLQPNPSRLEDDGSKLRRRSRARVEGLVTWKKIRTLPAVQPPLGYGETCRANPYRYSRSEKSTQRRMRQYVRTQHKASLSATCAERVHYDSRSGLSGGRVVQNMQT